MEPSISLVTLIGGPAVVVATSPLKIVPALIIVLNSTRPRPTSVAFLASSLIGLAGTTALFVCMPHPFEEVGPVSVDVKSLAPLALTAGAFLIAVAAFQMVKRNRPTVAPSRLARFARITPLGGAALGLLLTASNPKVLAMNAVAGMAIGEAGLSLPSTALALLTYTAVAGSTIIVPIVGYALAAQRVHCWLRAMGDRSPGDRRGATTGALAVLGLVLAIVGAYLWL